MFVLHVFYIFLQHVRCHDFVLVRLRKKKKANCKANVWVDFVRFTIRARQQFMYITNAFISWKKCLNKLNVDTLSLSVFSKVESLSVSNTWN